MPFPMMGQQMNPMMMQALMRARTMGDVPPAMPGGMGGPMMPQGGRPPMGQGAPPMMPQMQPPQGPQAAPGMMASMGGAGGLLSGLGAMKGMMGPPGAGAVPGAPDPFATTAAAPVPQVQSQPIQFGMPMPQTPPMPGGGMMGGMPDWLRRMMGQ